MKTDTENECRITVAVVLAALGMFSAPVMAQAPLPGLPPTQEVREADCLITHARRTESTTARSYIAKACNFMSLPTATWNLHRKENAFHACILDVLPGTDDDRNAIALVNACRTRAQAG